MNDCIWAVSFLGDEDERIMIIPLDHQIPRHRRSLKLCKPDSKTSETLPQNSWEFHDGKSGKQTKEQFISVGVANRTSIENRRTCILLLPSSPHTHTPTHTHPPNQPTIPLSLPPFPPSLPASHTHPHTQPQRTWRPLSRVSFSLPSVLVTVLRCAFCTS